MKQTKIIEAIPNISEGRNKKKIAKIAEVFKNIKGVELLNLESDADHNRTVLTILGEKEALKKTLLAFIKKTIDLIDINKHKGVHPRMGAVDVIPFVPIKNIGIKETVAFSISFSKEVYKKFGLPIFLYEHSSIKKEHKDLSLLRSGGFENMRKKKFAPDFGKEMHKTAGITAVGVRDVLIAFNVNLKLSDFEIAKKIAKKIRFSNGGLPFCKAIGIKLLEQNLSQISMNLTNYKKTSIVKVFKAIEKEARQNRVKIIESEIIGLIPKDALSPINANLIKVKNFSEKKIIENFLSLELHNPSIIK